MSNRRPNGWLRLSPPFPEGGAERIEFREHAARLARGPSHGDGVALPHLYELRYALDRAKSVGNPAALRGALCVLTDLARQRWVIRVTDDGNVEVKRPSGRHRDPRCEKARIRSQELVKRDEQLREPSTRRFVKRMERSTLYRGRPVSIFSLFRDGRELASSLRDSRLLPSERKGQALRKAIDPYLQFIADGARCEQTGIRLRDVWRYFRHTWSNQYTNTPGRSMAVLVRDRARDFHPVIGIGAISSPIMQIRERDTWIGWHPETFLEFASAEPSAQLGTWLNKVVDGAISELYLDDFVEDQLIGPADLRQPSPDVIVRLTYFGKEQRKLHHRFTRGKDLKRFAKYTNDSNEDSKGYWKERAQTHLYRSKRALALAEMLQARQVLREFIGESPSANGIRLMLASVAGRRTIKKVLRKAKADHVGIAMADITVCGAVAPYNHILGGKLVSMLLVSPEVVAAYRNRYLKYESQIASSMAGRPIVRPAKLALLCTTSLYGIGSSQYNRLQMPTQALGGMPNEWLYFRELGKSSAYGTSHFSKHTVEALVALVQQTRSGQRVNSIFGEGVSPKLRKVRDGLDALQLPTDDLLKHGRQRILYSVPLVRNLRKFLLGMDDEPDYLYDLSMLEQGTAAIVGWWTDRWLSRRVMSNTVLAQVDEHTLVRPIRHGARVTLPTIEDEHEFLFEDLAH